MASQATQVNSSETEKILPPPTWDVTNRHSYSRGLWLLSEKMLGAAEYYVICKGNKVEFLRRQGVRIGQDCEILTGTANFGTEPWLIELGNRVTITQGVLFLTHDGANRVFRHRIKDSAPWGNRFGTIRVLDNSFVGANAILLPGIQVGPNSIVGVGSVVNQRVPPNTVVAGVPARPICTLEEYVERYRGKMIPIAATNREELRSELTQRFWSENR